MLLHEYIALPQFSIEVNRKQQFLLDRCNELNRHHYMHCEPYRRVCDVVFNGLSEAETIAELPFLPVSIFKKFDLKSIPASSVYKVLTSSGTTGSVPSRIYLDAETARLQTYSLSKIMESILGTTRMPMLIIDSKEVLKNRVSFSARGAGILGLSVFGRDHTYLLDEGYQVDREALKTFLNKYNGQPIFIFGFTFMVWQYLYELLADENIDLSAAVLVHSGGWKKLLDIAVDNKTFKQALYERFGLGKVYNFYGMVEQVGTVFLENSEGHLHCPNFSDIIIRNPEDFSVQEHGKEGLIQVISILPESYPGFSLLTEDIGVCIGEDNAGNGWSGKYFKVLGRAKKAELRGCSDTFNSKTL